MLWRGSSSGYLFEVSDFKPPQNNRFIEWLGRVGLPLVMWWNNYEGISISRADVEKIRAIGSKRTIICSNHSHRHDPIFLFSFSAILNEQFNYIAAREIFDWWRGFHGWCIQRVGAYSITRGSLDRASISMSRKLIVEGKRKLVVFPECEISGSDDRLLPVEPGLAGLFLKSMEAVQQASRGEPVYVLPVSLKYKYVQDISQTLSNSLTRIENDLGLENNNQSLSERFNAVLKACVNQLASEFKFGHANWANTEESVDFDSIIEGLLEHVSDCLGVQVTTKDAPQAVHLLRNRLNETIRTKECISPYRSRLHAERTRCYEHLSELFNTIIRLAALKEFRPLSGMSQENLASGIDLLEREMFGKATQKGRRMVYLNVGDPINLLDRYELYKKDKRAEVGWLTAEIECQLGDMLGIPLTERIAA